MVMAREMKKRNLFIIENQNRNVRYNGKWLKVQIFFVDAKLSWMCFVIYKVMAKKVFILFHSASEDKVISRGAG